MTRPAPAPAPESSPSPASNARSGLKRLVEAVRVNQPKRQTPEAIRRRVALCKLWRPEDTAPDFVKRHPEHGDTETLGAKMSKIRGYLSDPVRGYHLSGWQIASRYLAEVHPSYLRSIEP